MCRANIYTLQPSRYALFILGRVFARPLLSRRSKSKVPKLLNRERLRAGLELKLSLKFIPILTSHQVFASFSRSLQLAVLYRQTQFEMGAFTVARSDQTREA